MIRLLPQLQFLGDGLITSKIGLMEIVQQAAALADHHQQTAAGTVILGVALQVTRQMVNALREKGNLHVGRAGIFRVRLKLFNRLCLRFHIINE